MDLAASISFNAFSINTVSRTSGGQPMSGYLVDEVNVSAVDVAQHLDKRAVQDGIDALDVYLGARHIGLIVSVFGSTPGDFWDKAQTLIQRFTPTIAYATDTANLGFLPFAFIQPTANTATWPTVTYPDGIPLEYFARPFGIPSYVIRRDEQGGSSGLGLSKQLRLALVCRDPRKYAQTAQTVTIGTSSSTVTNNGDYSSPPTITIISGATTGTTAVTIGSSSFTVSIDTASATYVLDCGQLTMKRNGVIHDDNLVAGSSFPLVASGANVCSRTSLTGITCTMTFRDAFA